ncbi:hypothetical protein, partial [Clostridium malenominatum]|uniref:hypothetical protein n=1 Tax=Clostridium malenominatum TaxID=1539 RepID=UPI0031DA2FD2
SFIAPMILQGQPCGKVGRRQVNIKKQKIYLLLFYVLGLFPYMVYDKIKVKCSYKLKNKVVKFYE